MRTTTLRSWIKELIQDENENKNSQQLTLLFESFGFKHGVPSDADLVFDVRSLPKPYYDLALRPLTGRDAPVIDFLQSQPMVLAMAEDIRAYVEKRLPSAHCGQPQLPDRRSHRLHRRPAPFRVHRGKTCQLLPGTW